MTKRKDPSYIPSSSQKEIGNTSGSEAALIAEGRASAEFSADIDAALNEALKETFPASDPISSLRAA